MEKIKKGHAALLCVAGLFTLYCLIMTIRGVILSDQTPKLRVIAIFLGYALVIFYMFYGYKKPHGNVLRYTLFAFAVLLVLSITAEQILREPGNMSAELGPIAQGLAPQDVPDMPQINPYSRPIQTLATGLAAILVSYISGRLNKIEKNKYLFTVVLVLLAVRAFINVDNRSMMLADINEIILWLDLNCAYMLRFAQHKEAGLSEE